MMKPQIFTEINQKYSDFFDMFFSEIFTSDVETLYGIAKNIETFQKVFTIENGFVAPALSEKAELVGTDLKSSYLSDVRIETKYSREDASSTLTREQCSSKLFRLTKGFKYPLVNISHSKLGCIPLGEKDILENIAEAKTFDLKLDFTMSESDFDNPTRKDVALLGKAKYYGGFLALFLSLEMCDDQKIKATIRYEDETRYYMRKNDVAFFCKDFDIFFDHLNEGKQAEDFDCKAYDLNQRKDFGNNTKATFEKKFENLQDCLLFLYPVFLAMGRIIYGDAKRISKLGDGKIKHTHNLIRSYVPEGFCGECGESEDYCDCDFCYDCGELVDEDCDCDRCRFCEKLVDDCDCDICDQCDNLMEYCDCEYCDVCENHEKNCDCVYCDDCGEHEDYCHCVHCDDCGELEENCKCEADEEYTDHKHDENCSHKHDENCSHKHDEEKDDKSEE